MSASGPSGPLVESYIVKTDCPVQIFRKMIKYSKILYRLWFTLLVLLFFLEIFKKKKKL